VSNFYSGQDGKLYIDGSESEAAKVVSWSFSASQSTLDTTSLSDTDRTLIEGVRSISGSCQIYYYSDANTSGDATTLINKLIKARETPDEPGVAAKQNASTSETSTILELGFKDYQGLIKKIKLSVILTNVSMTSSQGEVLSANISFEANGAPSSINL
tara:strand:+ start:925 stop:1398 length:474 start_codon:yes stop_codon:yes gene_type:complete